MFCIKSLQSFLWVYKVGKDPLQLKTSNFLQFLTRIVTHDIYLILCGFNECFKTNGFFKMLSVSYLDKTKKILEDSMGGNLLQYKVTQMPTNKIYGHMTLKHAHAPKCGALHTWLGTCLYDQD